MKYKVASVQIEPTLFEKDINVKEQLVLAEEAASAGAKLIVFPEMSTTGYCFANRAELDPIVEPIPGPTTANFGEVARKFGCYIVIGLAEIDLKTGAYYNSAVLVKPNGKASAYRKVHGASPEARWSKFGDLGFPVFETEIGKIGILICFDSAFPESSRALALQGTDVICLLTNSPWERCPKGMWMTRAYENGVYLVVANRWGKERGIQFCGGSCIINVDGSLQAYQDIDNGIVYGEVDTVKASTRRQDRLSGRRPEQYVTLSQNLHFSYPIAGSVVFSLYNIDPLPAGAVSTVGVAQFQPVAEDRQGNFSKIERFVQEAANAKCGLLVLPELCLTGSNGKSAFVSIAEPVPGPATESLTELAARHRIFLCLSLAEQDGKNLYNTAVLISNQGLVGKYRKIHLGQDASWAKAGDDFPVFDTPLGRIGMLVGEDLQFPEAARCLSILGADIICIPSIAALPEPMGIGPSQIPFASAEARAVDPWVRHLNIPDNGAADPLHWHVIRNRAGENTTYFAFANQSGYSGVFGTVRAGRAEQVIASNNEGLATMVIDTTWGVPNPSGFPTNPVRVKEMMAVRHPAWYGLLHTSRI